VKELDGAESEWERQDEPRRQRAYADQRDAQCAVEELEPSASMQVPEIEHVEHDWQRQAHLRFRLERHSEEDERRGVPWQRRTPREEQEERCKHKKRRDDVDLSKDRAVPQDPWVKEHCGGNQCADGQPLR
jgi:hypothetical protein